jgi:phosphocarrier protein
MSWKKFWDKKRVDVNRQAQYLNMIKNVIFSFDRIVKEAVKKTMAQQGNEKIESTFIVINEKGLHTRPSTELVKCAASFRSQITLIYQNMTVNAKSLLGILMLAAARGSKIKIEAEGEDAKEAVRSILELAKNKFYIKY